MAEAIGLAFGGIALTGLVSSCVDILEYTNNARYWLYDLSLALTKVALLQCRLDSLREVCLAATAIGHDKSGEGSGDWTSSTGCNVAAQGLSGVKSVLEQTYKLCRRYSLAHMERGGHYHATHRLQAPALAASYLGEPHLIVALKPWRRLGRQLSWALQDKKKFDKLILDLDFLLSNTEQLFQRTTQLSGPVCQPQGQKQIATAPSYTTSCTPARAGQAPPNEVPEDATWDLSTVSCTQLSQDSMLPRGAGSETKVATASRSRRAHSGIPKLVTVSQQSLVPFQPKERQALVSTMAPADGGAPDAQKNTYSGNDVKDNSRITIRTQNESVTSADNNKLEKFSHITVGDVDMPESNPAVLKLQIELAEGQKKLAQAKSKLRRRSRRNRDDDSDSSD